MKALRVEEPNKIAVVEIPEVKLEKDNEILIKVKAAGICGSDISIYLGKSPVASYPRILGHEVTGIVQEIGNSVTRFEVGDHVIIKQTESCNMCYACKHGRDNVCVDLKVRGVNIDGGYREHMTVPETSAYLIPKDLDFKTAVLIEPFTIAFQACARGRLQEDDTLLVYGVGALGSTIIQVAKSFGCKIIAVDIEEDKLDQAKRLGAAYTINGKSPTLKEEIQAASNDYGPTVCIDSVCNPGSFEFLVDVVGNAGRVVLMGFDTRVSEIAQFKITAKELDIIGSRLQHDKFEKVIDLFARDIIQAGDMISHVFNFKDIKKAFDVVSSRKFRKIVLTF
ncbi:zinc-binding alcohol dehydrogenase family protein [Halocella sp. SP3-1]|uniref:zinc-binding alcohol dehydrogenase family protein n=1 Tax=Halocella sp. SP3-1 TaxID=2382161 RepID=UPI000F74F505|nr:zinc-binding alcohol dehydrogenase family protein [Halocella sp. SP3-1]AZO93338.1 zinc-binding alcohol dehydrogenase family protein [Halocella sp. SP3-1]